MPGFDIYFDDFKSGDNTFDCSPADLHQTAIFAFLY